MNTDTTTLESSWIRCWKALDGTGSGEALMSRLIDAYNEPQRKYHTVQHLQECLSIFDSHIALAQKPGEVEMALWFHDAVYDVKASNNEAKSAEWAVLELTKAAVDPVCITTIKQHILVTMHSTPAIGGDQALLVDIDLAILGAKPERFEEYERQVREEYSYVPGFLYRRGRRKMLTSFLQRNPLYVTPALRQSFENQACDNIKASIKALASK